MVAALAFLQAPDGAIPMHQIKLTRPGIEAPYALLQDNTDPFEPPFLSPKKFGIPAKPWEFSWISRSLPFLAQNNQYELRFRVFSQEKKENNDLGLKTNRMLTALWGEMFTRAKTDHSIQYNGRIIDVYLCWGGQAGGEQRFDVVPRGTEKTNVNTIYIYDVNSFTDPMEMAREVAHEYGHAVLPAIGGYTAPENWANGFLGEKVFLSWVREGLAEGRLTPEDSMGATKDQIDAWLNVHSNPLITAAAQVLPTAVSLKDPSAKGMDKYLGLALFANQVLPNSVFWHSMIYTGSTEAKDYPAALVVATAEPDQYEIKIPKFLADKPIWLPTGKGKVMGGKILKSQGSWVQIQAPEGTLTVKNR